MTIFNTKLFIISNIELPKLDKSVGKNSYHNIAIEILNQLLNKDIHVWALMGITFYQRTHRRDFNEEQI